MIRPNDPWYPLDDEQTGSDAGVIIRLKLAADALKSPWLPELCDFYANPDEGAVIDAIFGMADRMIERVNRGETDDGK